MELCLRRLAPTTSRVSSQAFNSLPMTLKCPFSTSPVMSELRKLARVKVVDNSPVARANLRSGRPVKILHVYNKTGVGMIGDKVLVAIEHQKRKGYIVGCKQKQQAFVPKFDTNNVVLVDDLGLPLGTRIKVPLPSVLRQNTDGNFLKILSLANKFV